MVTTEIAGWNTPVLVLSLAAFALIIITCVISFVRKDHFEKVFLSCVFFTLALTLLVSSAKPSVDADVVANDLGIVSVEEMKVPKDGGQTLLNNVIVKEADGTLVKHDYIELSRQGNTVTMTPVENIVDDSSSDSAETE